MQSKNNNDFKLRPVHHRFQIAPLCAPCSTKVKFDIHIRRFHNGLFMIYMCAECNFDNRHLSLISVFAGTWIASVCAKAHLKKLLV